MVTTFRVTPVRPHARRNDVGLAADSVVSTALLVPADEKTVTLTAKVTDTLVPVCINL